MGGPARAGEGDRPSAIAGAASAPTRAARFRTYERLVSHGRAGLRKDALAVATAALAAVATASALRRSVRIDSGTLCVNDPATGDERRLALRGRRVFVVGAGKASIGMAAVLDELLGPTIADGAVIVKHGETPAPPLRHIEVVEAAHPVLDEQSLRGGLRLLGIAEQAQPADLLLALITGGSSSLAIVPAGDISFDDKVATNRLLLASGADIVSINIVRKHLSRIKGGQLAAVAGCQIVNLTVSDVVGDPPDAFTDLTVPDRSTFAMAREVCDRYDLWERLPWSVTARLRRADPTQETPKPGAFPPDRTVTIVLANSALLCRAAAREAERLGYAARVVSLEIEGEATLAGRALAGQIAGEAPGTALIDGGENTVALADAHPHDGSGGPNQEAALAAAQELAGSCCRPAPAAPVPAATGETRPDTGCCVLCLDTDGTDGPTDAAGGLVDDLTAAEAGERDIDVCAALAAHTSRAALAALDDLIVTGPTGTNVNDLKIALRGR